MGTGCVNALLVGSSRFDEHDIICVFNSFGSVGNLGNPVLVRITRCDASKICCLFQIAPANVLHVELVLA